VKTCPDTLLGRLALASRPSRPWLRVRASGWWGRVLLAAGAQQASWKGQDLSGADLADVTWSVQTLWPVGLGETMLRRSVPIGGGKWRV
jgi:hypothetical protein